MTLEAAETGDSDEAAGDPDDEDDDGDDGEAEDMELFQESGLLDEVDPVSSVKFCYLLHYIFPGLFYLLLSIKKYFTFSCEFKNEPELYIYR